MRKDDGMVNDDEEEVEEDGADINCRCVIGVDRESAGLAAWFSSA